MVPLAVSGLLVVISTLVFGVTAMDALRVEGPEAFPGQDRIAAREIGPVVAGDSTSSAEGVEAPGASGAAGGTPESGAFRGPAAGLYPRVSRDELLEAVNQDLFMQGRRPPMTRYQLPSQRMAPLPETEDQDPRRGRGPELRVVGSAMTDGIALALIQVDDSPPLAILVGEEVEGYTLAAVDKETATLVRDSETLILSIVEAIHTAPGHVVGPQVGRADPQTIEALQGRIQEMMNARRQNANRGGRGGGQP